MKEPIRLALLALAPGVLVPDLGVAQDDGLAQEDIDVAVLDPRARSLSAEELETFADIFVEIEEISTSHETELASVESEQEAELLRARMERERQETIERHGWTEAKYDEVTEIVDASPPLLARVLALIGDRP
ncbi:MAG TPA: DUF4168 domain-containing protein [Gammaproteobacteria bacterium]